MKPLDEGLRFISRAAHFLRAHGNLNTKAHLGTQGAVGSPPVSYGAAMAKKGRKRRARRKNKANHGKRPNAGRKS
jgi:hypothetical protein